MVGDSGTPRKYSRRRRIVVIAGALVILSAVFPGCSPLYVLRASWEEAGILMRREKIDKLVSSDNIDKTAREKLKLVKAAREFALSLKLEPKDSFTYYSTVDRDVLAWVLTAAPKNRLDSYTWWFPVVGSIPYKGFFEKEDGMAAAKALSGQGYDIYLRPTQAYSTLGWFNDPILSTTLAASEVPLVDTVIHEILHNTLWVKNHVSFNESLANFVGAHGAVEFFQDKQAVPLPSDRSAALLETARERLDDQMLFARFINDLSADLKALYDSSDFKESTIALTPEQITLRDGLFARYRARFEELRPKFRSPGYKRNLVDFNNASVIADSLYYDRLWEFQDVFNRTGASLVNFIAAMKELDKRIKKTGNDPFVEMEQLITEMPGVTGGQETER